MPEGTHGPLSTWGIVDQFKSGGAGVEFADAEQGQLESWPITRRNTLSL